LRCVVGVFGGIMGWECLASLFPALIRSMLVFPCLEILLPQGALLHLRSCTTFLLPPFSSFPPPDSVYVDQKCFSTPPSPPLGWAFDSSQVYLRVLAHCAHSLLFQELTIDGVFLFPKFFPPPVVFTHAARLFILLFFSSLTRLLASTAVALPP